MTGSGTVHGNDRPRRVAVGDGARRALPDADYADAFRVEAESLLPAATRTRLAFGALPPAVNRLVSSAWRQGLGLRLAAVDDPAYVVGWTVTENAPERLVLHAASWLVDACLVVDAAHDHTTVSTLIHYRNAAGRAAWAVVEPAHRRVAPVVLERGRRAMDGPA